MFMQLICKFLYNGDRLLSNSFIEEFKIVFILQKPSGHPAIKYDLQTRSTSINRQDFLLSTNSINKFYESGQRLQWNVIQYSSRNVFRYFCTLVTSVTRIQNIVTTTILLFTQKLVDLLCISVSEV